MKKNLFTFLLSSFFFLSVASATTLNKFSRQLSKGVSGLASKKVAVISFLYHDSKFSSGSSIVAERLTTSLVGKNNIVVIERRLIKKILEEQKMSETGIVDASTAKKIGSVLGVDAIITGTLIDLEGNKTEVNARMIESETGQILSAAQLMIERTWQDKPRAIVVVPPAAVTPVAEPVVEEVAAPTPSSGPSIRLSNENFPPGRRAYHRENGASGETKSRASGEEEYDNGYDDNQPTRKKEKKEPYKKEERSLTDRRLEESKREKPRRILR